MLELIYTAPFVRKLNALETALQDEVIEKLELFRDPKNHERLRLHKLRGEMKAYHSFSVNYTTRVVVRIVKKKAIAFMVDVGDHDVYQ